MRLITKIRLAKGWSQNELARRAGIHPSTVSQIEGGRQTPPNSSMTLKRLAGPLEISEERAHSLLDDIKL